MTEDELTTQYNRCTVESILNLISFFSTHVEIWDLEEDTSETNINHFYETFLYCRGN